jgi:hypothetical protein
MTKLQEHWSSRNKIAEHCMERLCCPTPARKANAGGGMRECNRSAKSEKRQEIKNYE